MSSAEYASDHHPQIRSNCAHRPLSPRELTRLHESRLTEQRSTAGDGCDCLSVRTSWMLLVRDERRQSAARHGSAVSDVQPAQVRREGARQLLQRRVRRSRCSSSDADS